MKDFIDNDQHPDNPLYAHAIVILSELLENTRIFFVFGMCRVML